MNRIEYWMFQRIVKKCRAVPGVRCSPKCPYYRDGGRNVVKCRIGMPWQWQLGVRP